MARSYNRVTPEVEASVLAARHHASTASYDEISARTGVPPSRVKYILTDLPRLRRTQGGDKLDRSLKDRIYQTVRAVGEVKDVAELRRLLGMADDDHSVLHVLHSLHTQGKIDFTERGNGNGNATVIHIRLPRKGTPVEVEPEAITLDTPVTAPSAPEPEPEGYPLLDALLEREGKRLDGDAKGMAFVVAAEAIEKVDPDTAALLMQKAERYNVPFPSPLEREFLRYVAEHP